MDDTCTIDQLTLPVRRPASVAELGDLVREAAAAGGAVYPLGGRTQLHVGMPPERPGVGVDLRGLSAVLDYPARDMTITVQPGITMAELQRVLAAEGQRLPVDVPRAGEATLGGSLAVNVSGPRRLGGGTFRDYVIGISTVNDEGVETKAGGRVVKNVAGYDLCKLHVGALGTLGVISQVTLKVRPRPESTALCALACEDANLGRLLDVLHASRTRPMAIDLLNAPATATLNAATQGGAELGLGGLAAAPWLVLVGYEDGDEVVCWQVQQLIRETSEPGLLRGASALGDDSARPLWQGLADATATAGEGVTFQAGLLPGSVADFCRAAARHGVHLHAHAGSGVVRGLLSGGLTREAASVMLNELSALAQAARGHLTLPRCPPAWKRDLPVWGAPRGDLAVMRQVKEKLDPRRLFNPGRFLDGI